MNDINHMIFKNDIQTQRKLKDISQNKLSRELSMRRDQLSIIENGHRLPTKETLIAIKEILNVKYIDLYSQEVINIILGKIGWRGIGWHEPTNNK